MHTTTQTTNVHAINKTTQIMVSYAGFEWHHTNLAPCERETLDEIPSNDQLPFVTVNDTPPDVNINVP
jgi:hypothetical protein